MNTNLLAATFAMMVMAGAIMIVSGSTKREVLPSQKRQKSSFSAVQRRKAYFAVGTFVVILVLTRWPVMAIGGLFLGWNSKMLFGGKAARNREIERTEAIAMWTEMLRDTLAAAHGLEAAVVATAGIAPDAIKEEILEFARVVQNNSLESGLASLSVQLEHPIGDLVVTALTLAAGGSARELTELLTTLSDTAREEATLRLRVDAARAKVRSNVKIMIGATIAFVLGMPLVSADFLKPLDSAEGQVVMVVVVGMRGMSLTMLNSMSKYKVPERFLAASVDKNIDQVTA